MHPRPEVLFLDANVLYSACCRDLLLEASLAGLCHCRWSDLVLAEVRRALVRHRPELSASRLDRLFQLLAQACPDAQVCVRSAPWVAWPAGLDEADRHVVASAYAAGADAIITFNLKHFPSSSLGRLGLKVMSPDQWLAGQAKTDDVRLSALVERCRGRLGHPPLGRSEHLKALRRAGLIRLADHLGHRPTP